MHLVMLIDTSTRALVSMLWLTKAMTKVRHLTPCRTKPRTKQYTNVRSQNMPHG